MSLTADLISGPCYWLALIGYAGFMLYAVRQAPWRILLGNRPLQHLFLGASVGLMVLWMIRAGISPGLGIHFLGVTTITLMFGWELGAIGASLALLGMTLVGEEAGVAFPLNGLCAILVPVLVSYGVLRVVDRYLPRQFFTYLFVCVFLGAALAASASGLSMVALLWLGGVYDLDKLSQEYLIYLPLILFPEALLNGFLMTGMMVYYPDWIRTFDARRYIDEQ